MYKLHLNRKQEEKLKRLQQKQDRKEEKLLLKLIKDFDDTEAIKRKAKKEARKNK